MSTTRVSCRIAAPRERVYRALIDPHALAGWMVPEGMSSVVHAHDAREGGAFRITLTYDEPTGTGKTTEHADTYHGYFVELVPGRKVVQRMEFESDDPAMAGEHTVTMLLVEHDDGTELTAVHEDLPPGVPAEANELGWRSSLGRLAAMFDRGGPLDPRA